jgi:hypothetical protein
MSALQASSGSAVSDTTILYTQSQVQRSPVAIAPVASVSVAVPRSSVVSRAFPISQNPLNGRISPVVAIVEKALSAYDEYEGKRLVAQISNIIDLVFAVTDSFSADYLPEIWKAKFKAIEHQVTPKTMTRGLQILLQGSAKEDILKCFPKLAPLFNNVIKAQ